MNIKQYLDECSRHYYNGSPIISDEVFDRLAESVGYNQVGAKQHEHLQKHYYRLLSLQKFYENEDKENPLLGEKDVTHSWKLDGAAISILYVDGKLARVLTRGDGVEGTDITEKFISTNLIPHTLRANLPVLQINGEIVAPKHIENARNYAAGSLNLKSVEDFKTRAVSFFAYGIYPFINDTYEQDMMSLQRLGFNTILDAELDKIYPCDGVVYRVNNNKRFEELGYTSSFPKGAYAKKTRGSTVESTLLDVEWSTGRTGRVTPTAILSPVYIGDKLVSRATLNNPGFIENLDLHIGDKVAIMLGGEIIPVVCHKIE